jgi:hypothetical protein
MQGLDLKIFDVFYNSLSAILWRMSTLRRILSLSGLTTLIFSTWRFPADHLPDRLHLAHGGFY